MNKPRTIDASKINSQNMIPQLGGVVAIVAIYPILYSIFH